MLLHLTHVVNWKQPTSFGCTRTSFPSFEYQIKLSKKEKEKENNRDTYKDSVSQAEQLYWLGGV